MIAELAFGARIRARRHWATLRLALHLTVMVNYWDIRGSLRPDFYAAAPVAERQELFLDSFHRALYTTFLGEADDWHDNGIEYYGPGYRIGTYGMQGIEYY